MTPNERNVILNATYDIERTLKRIKDYCDNRCLHSDEYEEWIHVALEADWGLMRVKDIESSMLIKEHMAKIK